MGSCFTFFRETPRIKNNSCCNIFIYHLNYVKYYIKKDVESFLFTVEQEEKIRGDGWKKRVEKLWHRRTINVYPVRKVATIPLRMVSLCVEKKHENRSLCVAVRASLPSN